MKKFITLITTIKILLIAFTAYIVMDMIDGFWIGWNDVKYDDDTTQSVSLDKETVSVKPLRDSVFYSIPGYVVTGIKGVQIQEKKNVEHPTIYYIVEIFKFIVAIAGMIFIVNFLKNSFIILNRYKELKVFEKDNLPILNKVAINLLLFACMGLLSEFISYIGYYYTIKIPGYKISFDFENAIDFGSIIIALILLAFSKILSLAIELKQENDLTV